MTQPVKKLKKEEREWVIDPHGWQVLGSESRFCIEDLGSTVRIDGTDVRTDSIVFYKEKWIRITKDPGRLEKRDYR